VNKGRALVVSGLVALSACGPAAEPLTPPPPLPPPLTTATAPASTASAAPDPMSVAPPPAPEGRFIPPRVEERRLANGIRLLVTERHELPIVAFRLAFERGADQGPPGVGSFLAAMLFQGTTTRSAIALDDELRRLGISAEPSADYDSLAVSAQCLSDKLPKALEIVADIVQNPAFSKDEIERARSRRLTSLIQQNDKPSTLLGTTTLALLYPEGHPYHVPVMGNEAAVKAITAGALRSFHKANLVPERLTIAVAGDITLAEAAPLIERAFGSWRGSAPKPTIPAPPSGPSAPAITLVDRPGLTQSSVSVIRVGLPRLTPDFDAVSMMNVILGGYYSSRLNTNLREKHGYTYGAQSSFEFHRGAGPFSAGATVAREHTGAALKEILAELARMRDELVSQEELDEARARAIRKLPARFESAAFIAGAMSALSVEGLPLDEFATRPERFQKVTREDVKRVATTLLAPETLRVVVVGDAAIVKAQLDALGLGDVVLQRPPKAEPSAPAKALVKSGAGAAPKPKGATKKR
jgi:zinc protease